MREKRTLHLTVFIFCRAIAHAGNFAATINYCTILFAQALDAKAWGFARKA